MQPDAPGDGRQFLKLCGLFVVTSALCHTDPHVGGVKQTKIIIFYGGQSATNQCIKDYMGICYVPSRNPVSEWRFSSGYRLGVSAYQPGSRGAGEGGRLYAVQPRYG